jgi:FG-GAP repeat
MVAATLATLVVGLVSQSSAGRAAFARRSVSVNLLQRANLIRIDGAAAGDNAGVSVAGAGDVNGDGRGDVLVGAHFADNNARADSGSAYVVFGRAAPAAVDLAALGPAGVRIDGAAAGDNAGWSVAGAGDLNGDGRADVLVGAPRGDNNAREGSGSAYVVFGRAAPGTVDLAALGQGGFRIDGAAAGDDAGWSVAGVGDLNGDGPADVLVGARFAGNNARECSGSAYVVFGRAAPGTVDLAALGQAGFRIDGAAVCDLAG